MSKQTERPMSSGIQGNVKILTYDRFEISAAKFDHDELAELRDDISNALKRTQDEWLAAKMDETRQEILLAGGNSPLAKDGDA